MAFSGGSQQNRDGGSGRGMGMGSAPPEAAPSAPQQPSGNIPSGATGGPVATPPVPPLPVRPVSNQAPSWAPPGPPPAQAPAQAPRPMQPLNPNYQYDNPIHPAYKGMSYRPGSTVKTFDRDGRPLGPYHVLGHESRVGHQPGAIVIRGRDGNAYRAIPFRRGRDGQWRNGDWHRGRGWDGGGYYGHNDGGRWGRGMGGDRRGEHGSPFHEYARRFGNVQYMGLSHLGPPRHGVNYDRNGTMSYMANGYKYIIPRGGFGYIPPHAYGGGREGHWGGHGGGRGGHWDGRGGRGGHGGPWEHGGRGGGWDGHGGGRNPGPWEHSPGQQYPNHGGGGGYGGHSGGGGGGSYGGSHGDGGYGRNEWFHGRGYDDYYRRGHDFHDRGGRWDDMWNRHWGHGWHHPYWGRHGRWGRHRHGRGGHRR